MRVQMVSRMLTFVNPMCVVLVEDEPNLRMIAAELLTDAGHIVIEFSTAAEAKAYADVPENWLTTVLTDINMPGEEDGLDLAVHIRATRPQATVIVTSGRYAALPSRMPDGIAFLPKPWTGEELVQAIGAVQVRP